MPPMREITETPKELIVTLYALRFGPADDSPWPSSALFLEVYFAVEDEESGEERLTPPIIHSLN